MKYTNILFMSFLITLFTVSFVFSGISEVFLNWSDNTETDLNHYNVYRSVNKGVEYIKINIEPVILSEYLDRNIVYSTTYYVVTAVDNSGNESAYSENVIIHSDLENKFILY